jgi:hypothetical protein
MLKTMRGSLILALSGAFFPACAPIGKKADAPDVCEEARSIKAAALVGASRF